jgi:type I restriction-modification system DNA methylase subunit
MNFVQGVKGLINPAQYLNDLVEAWTEYKQIVEEETTKRYEIEAWEKTTLAEIKAKSDFLIGYLDRSFDERATNLRSLLEAVDRAILADDNRLLNLTLQAIIELAKSNSFLPQISINIQFRPLQK